MFVVLTEDTDGVLREYIHIYQYTPVNTEIVTVDDIETVALKFCNTLANYTFHDSVY